MRILHVIRSLDPSWGGPVEGARNITAQAKRHGVVAEVVCLDAPGSSWLSSWPVPVHPVGAGIAGFGYSPRLNHWFAANIRRFDGIVVHGIWMYFSIAARKAAVHNGVPYYLFIHGALDPWFKKQYPLKHIKKMVYWRLFQHKVLRDAAAVLFTSEEEKQLAHNAFHPYRCQPVVVGYGIAPPHHADARNDREALNQNLTALYPSLAGRRFLLYLGRIHEKKGIDLLLRSFARLRDEYVNYAVVVAGPGDPHTVSGLQKLGSALGIDDRIVWTGPLYGDAKWLALKAADAYVLPSHQENFGISVVEALACGTPVLITNKVNIWREVDHAKAGLIEPDDLAGTTHLLSRWSRITQGDREIMAANALQCFSANFDITSNCERIFDMLRNGCKDNLAAIAQH
jgi:glycosyltransferase involved in cell wall biosynthesis